MRSDLFQAVFSRAPIAAPDHETTQTLVRFAAEAFGNSEWHVLHGGKKPYYFDFDKAYSRTDAATASKVHNAFASFIGRVWDRNRPVTTNAEVPVLAYVCPSDAPIGIVQARGALSDRLGWPSVVVFPDKRLLRSRVVAARETPDKYPESVRWIRGRYSILLADTATTGESIARAVGAIRAFGCEPVSAAVVYNREEGAEESLATIRMPLYELLTPSLVEDDKSIGDRTRAAIKASHRKIVRDLSFYVSAAG
jgi:hypothetical protein